MSDFGKEKVIAVAKMENASSVVSALNAHHNKASADASSRMSKAMAAGLANSAYGQKKRGSK